MSIIAISLFLFLVISWTLYALFGHWLIEAAYEGKLIGLFNKAIIGQEAYDVGYYFQRAEAIGLFYTGPIAMLIFMFCIMWFFLLTRHKIKPLAFIIIAFLLSRLMYNYSGIQFDSETIYGFWQFLDPAFLKTNLIESIYYLHSQPPLFNLFLGVILKLFPYGYTPVFYFIYLILGAICIVSIFLIMTKMGISRELSGLFTILFMFSPASILYENWLYYTYPVTVFLVLAALFLHKFLVSKKTKDGFIFFMLLALIVLTRAVFHFVWFLFFAFMALFYLKGYRKKVILAAFIPFIIVLALYLKNLYVFGTFTSSSWLGMNFSKISTFTLLEEEREQLVKEKKLSRLALIPNFFPVEDYKEYLKKHHNKTIPKTNIPVLDQELKTNNTDDFNNYNHIIYVEIAKLYLKDTIYVFTHYPKIYLQSVGKSFFIYFMPASDFPFLRHNHKYIRPLNILFYGQGKPGETAVFIVVTFVITVIYGLYLILKNLFKKPEDLAFAITIIFILVNIIYVTLICNFLEILENQRFHFLIYPLTFIILGLFLNKLFTGDKSLSL